MLENQRLLPEIEPPVNSQVEQHDLPFIQALHAMFVAILAARKVGTQTLPHGAPASAQRISLPSAGGPHAPPPPGAPGMPTQPHRTHLAMGKALSGRPTGLAAGATVDGRQRHSVLH